jgi:DNA uptake protein ComE-like DNA-binding protein
MQILAHTQGASMVVISTRLATMCAAGALVLGLAGCGGSTTPSGGGAPAAAAAPTTGAVSTGTPATGPDTAGSTAKVSANTASEDEIAAALKSAGVSNSERWAEEVVEYRPYPADDKDLTKLRKNLAKYNPGQETTDMIVSALTP